MNNYKELVENVRICASGDCFGCTPRGNKINCQEVLLESAADAIEQLVKERDAAVADLKEGSFCMTCKHLVSTQEKKLCRHCSSLTGGGEDNWEWRGVQEVEHEID